MGEAFDRLAHRVATAAGSPWAFLAALALVVGWAVTGPVFHFATDWQLVINTGTTIVTFLMVFLIQGATNRQEAAMQAKLDELIRAIDRADNRLVGAERPAGEA